MFGKFRPLPCRKVEKAIKKLGFDEVPKTGGGSSHRQFKKRIEGKLYKTTLDCHNGEVGAKNIRSMISQMGVTKKEFYNAVK